MKTRYLVAYVSLMLLLFTVNGCVSPDIERQKIDARKEKIEKHKKWLFSPIEDPKEIIAECGDKPSNIKIKRIIQLYRSHLKDPYPVFEAPQFQPGKRYGSYGWKIIIPFRARNGFGGYELSAIKWFFFKFQDQDENMTEDF